MKYVIFEGDSFIIFPDGKVHADMAKGKAVKSAGFISIQNGVLHCYGSSFSLGTGSHVEDDSIVNSAFKEF